MTERYPEIPTVVAVAFACAVLVAAAFGALGGSIAGDIRRSATMSRADVVFDQANTLLATSQYTPPQP